MFNSFLSRWRTLTRNQQLIIGIVAALLVLGFLSGNGVLRPQRMLGMVGVIFLSLPLREWSKAMMAVRLGDETPRLWGRLSLNPIDHIDLWGAVVTFVFGFGWGKRVNFNADRTRFDPKIATLLIVGAGLLASLLLALIAYLLLELGVVPTAFINEAVGWFASITIGLAVFNLLPIPPLDGAEVLKVYLGNRYADIYWSLAQYGWVIILVVLMLAPGIVGGPTLFFSNILRSIVGFVV